jgi:hypothetical protein
MLIPIGKKRGEEKATQKIIVFSQTTMAINGC